jgi:hypothetical protein
LAVKPSDVAGIPMVFDHDMAEEKAAGCVASDIRIAAHSPPL